MQRYDSSESLILEKVLKMTNRMEQYHDLATHNKSAPSTEPVRLYVYFQFPAYLNKKFFIDAQKVDQANEGKENIAQLTRVWNELQILPKKYDCMAEKKIANRQSILLEVAQHTDFEIDDYDLKIHMDGDGSQEELNLVAMESNCWVVMELNSTSIDTANLLPTHVANATMYIYTPFTDQLRLHPNGRYLDEHMYVVFSYDYQQQSTATLSSSAATTVALGAPASKLEAMVKYPEAKSTSTAATAARHLNQMYLPAAASAPAAASPANKKSTLDPRAPAFVPRANRNRN